MRQKM